MTPMPGMANGAVPASPAALFAMWAVMMAAMMIPCVAVPMLARGVIFAAGYLAVWTAFGAVAAIVHWGLDAAGLLSVSMALRSGPLTSMIVAGAGLYQFSAIKRDCLFRCRSDFALQSHGPRGNRWRRLADGMRHGRSCVGCCWALTALLFAGGVMNVVWMAALAVWMLIERTVPRAVLVSRVAGVALVIGAIALRLHNGS